MARILIVDDSAQVRSALSDVLSAEGFDTEEAEDGKQAIRKLCERTVLDDLYDGVILDLAMPVVDGWQVLEAIDRNPLWCDTQVVVLSGTTDSLDDVCRVTGLDGLFVAKKTDYSRIVRVLAERQRYLTAIGCVSGPYGASDEVMVRIPRVGGVDRGRYGGGYRLECIMHPDAFRILSRRTLCDDSCRGLREPCKW